MTPTLPPKLRAKAEAARAEYGEIEGWDKAVLFDHGVEWLYAELLKGAGEFDNVAAFNSCANYCSPSTPKVDIFIDGARWQHAQSATTISALRAEVDNRATPMELFAELEALPISEKLLSYQRQITALEEKLNAVKDWFNDLLETPIGTPFHEDDVKEVRDQLAKLGERG